MSRVASHAVPSAPVAVRSQVPNATSEPYLGLAARRRASNYDSLSAPTHRIDQSQDVRKRDPTPPSNFDILHRNLVPLEAVSGEMPPQSGASLLYSSAGTGHPRRSELPQLQTSYTNRSSSDRASLTSQDVPSPIRARTAAVRAAQLSAAAVVHTPVSAQRQTSHRQDGRPAYQTGWTRDDIKGRKPIATGPSKVNIPTTTTKSLYANVAERPGPDSSWYEPMSRAQAAADTEVRSRRDLTNGTTQPQSYEDAAREIDAARAQILEEASRQLEMLSETAYRAWNETQLDSTYHAASLVPTSTLSQHDTARNAAPPIKSPPTPSSHFGTLGARTISPTDVRRLQRKSIAAIPIRQRSPTPELTFGSRPASGFPEVHPAKAPSPPLLNIPNRTNSAHQRGASLSSKSSHGSFHRSNSSLQRRTSTEAWLHKNAVAEARSASRQADPTAEIVPPVPAIPKVYESPPDMKEQTFLQDYITPSRVSEVNFSTKTFRRQTAAPSISTPARTAIDAQLQPVARRVELSTNDKSKSSDVAGIATTSRQLSHRMQSRPDVITSREPLPQQTLPSARLMSSRTQPSNPVAAPRNQAVVQELNTSQNRSSIFEPHQLLRLRGDHNNMAAVPQAVPPVACSDSSSTASFVEALSHIPSPDPTPLVSDSSHFAPQTTPSKGPASSVPTQTLDGHSDVKMNTATPKRRPVTNAVASAKSSGTMSLSQSVAASGSSLRRKLSLGRRTGSAKNPPANQQQSTTNTAPTESTQDNIQVITSSTTPRAKLPRSPTWGGVLRQNQEPVFSQNLVQVPDILPGLLNPSKIIDATGTTGISGKAVPSSHMKQLPPRPLASSKSSSLLVFSSQKSVSHTPRATSPSVTPRRHSTRPDAEDLAAEEEMRRLVLKKREFEGAAREVDELRRRATAKDRVSPSQALRSGILNLYERGEIIDFQDIYFCGSQNTKKTVAAADLVSQSTNYGYDDERGDYNIVAGDHLAYRYEVVDMLGKGSFGQVVRCIDHKTGKLAAIKIIRNKKRFHQQALVEVGILQRLREWVYMILTCVATILT